VEDFVVQLAGELTKISLPSLIQLLRNGELTGKVCLTQGANTAFIYVRDGRIVQVETDADEGRPALLELFLWLSGTFTFVEASLDNIPERFSPDEPAEKLIREGMAYLDKKKHLDQLRVNGRTILRKAHEKWIDNPIWEQVDGSATLSQINYTLGLSRWESINFTYDLLVNGHAVVVEPPAQEEQVQLPAWVISRLKQDNPDLTQAIVEMVIWVDRVKCWMYQADADIDNIVSRLNSGKAAPDALPAPGAAAEGIDLQKPGFTVAALIAELKEQTEGNDV
jgi:hypothetical protein